jgi:TonB-linked SusC/RagA family outer membrane protein
MKRFVLIFAFLVFACVQFLQAQGVQITGTVTSSEDGAPLPGVAIVVQGTTMGAVTDLDGNYSLNVPSDANILIFSFVGMKTQEVDITGRTTVDVILEPDILGLDEVVVTALGISREKKSLGYATQEVSGDEVNRTKGDNFINSISGKVSGVHVKSTGNMGGSTNVVIRGATSFIGTNQALFVIDGVPIDNANTNNDGQLDGRSGYDFGTAAADINPADIESISVLKGAAATALYGSRAARGVIMITTKKGSGLPGKAVGVALNSSVSFGTYDKSTFPKYQTQYGGGYGPYYSEGDHPGLEEYDFDGDGTDDLVVPFYEDASMGEKFDPNLMVYQWGSLYRDSPTFGQKTPWVASKNDPGSFFQTGLTFNNNIVVSGGGEKSTFRLSYTNLNERGIYENSDLKRNNFLFTGTHNITDKLSVTASANYINTRAKGRNGTGYGENIMMSFRQWWQMNVDIQELKDMYELTKENNTWNPVYQDDLSPIYWDNPYWHIYENYPTDERGRIIGYARADYKLTSWLSLMGRFSVDTYKFLQEERKAQGSVAGELGVDRPDVTSGYSRFSQSFIETNFDLMANFDKDLTENINMTALLGTNIRRLTDDRVFESTNGGLSVAEVYSLGVSANPMLPPEEDFEEVGVNGFFGGVSLAFYGFAFLDATYRIDQSSTLPSDNRTYGYPSVSGSLLFSELFQSSWLSYGKLRINYAEVGNGGQWGYLKDVYIPASPFGSAGVASVDHRKRNPDLKEERTRSLEAGLELNVFMNRLRFDLAVYQTTTVDQIMPVALSYTTGYTDRIYNAGDMRNKGIELSLAGTPLRTSDFTWDLALNWTVNRNEVTKLFGDIQNLDLKAGTGLQGGVSINARIDEPYGTIQGQDYVYHDNGQPIVLPTGYYQKSTTSDKVIGYMNPDWHAGLNNTLRYRNWSLDFLIDWQQGGDIFSLDLWYGMGTGLYEETAGLNDLGNPMRDPVIPIYEDPDAEDPVIIGYDPASGGIIKPGVQADGTPNTVRIPADRYSVRGWARDPNAAFVYDASYIKLRELVLTYQLPSALMERTFISRASVSLIGSNLWIIHKNLPHADPEMSQSSGNIQGWQCGVLPAVRNFGVSLNLEF